MFGAIPASILIEYGKKIGVYEQLPLLETPPKYTLDEKYMTDVYCGLTCEYNEYGKSHSVMSHIDHPAFTTLRDHLEAKGYIKTERNWHNGDVVLKEFMLNEHTFKEGDQFPCATAIGNIFRLKSIDNES